ncbi:MAG: response regulator [Planctomycetota bacterium]|jgi:two-component system chemotaxis response regulator CheY|nr:response regulator [Planctomycetota bacterium]
MRALVIDDDPEILLIISSILTRFGYEVITASDGQEGLDRLTEFGPPDVILVDWIMPVMNGLEFVKFVRKKPMFDGLPIIMVTTELEMSQLALTFDAGVSEYIMKPFEPIMIQEKLKMVGVVAL